MFSSFAKLIYVKLWLTLFDKNIESKTRCSHFFRNLDYDLQEIRVIASIVSHISEGSDYTDNNAAIYFIQIYDTTW